ncbi:MAG: FecR domain-containing protein [Rudanella sp.]|nr:FecR domain-containing protein [Rudanella sp.]
MSDELLAKYIAGEATPDERTEVRQWLADDPDHPLELARFERIWQAAGNRSEPENRQLFDTDTAWSRVRGQMHQPEQSIKKPSDYEQVVKPIRQTPRWISWARVAAAVLLVGTLSVLTYRSFQGPDSIDQTTTFLTQSTTKTTRSLTLPDGSTVLLNRNSSIRYPNTFLGQTREVTLIGEAFFDVKPNTQQPFIIHAQDTDVRVVGTSFGVRAYDRNVRVSVKTGRVVVRKKQQEVVLIPGQQATIDPTADTLRRLPRFDANALAYSTKQLNFTNQSLASVVETLSDYYQTDINLSASSLQTCRLTARFENESVETVLGVVAETLQLSVKRTDKGFVLSGEGCGQ